MCLRSVCTYAQPMPSITNVRRANVARWQTSSVGERVVNERINGGVRYRDCKSKLILTTSLARTEEKYIHVCIYLYVYTFAHSPGRVIVCLETIGESELSRQHRGFLLWKTLRADRGRRSNSLDSAFPFDSILPFRFHSTAIFQTHSG